MANRPGSAYALRSWSASLPSHPWRSWSGSPATKSNATPSHVLDKSPRSTPPPSPTPSTTGFVPFQSPRPRRRPSCRSRPRKRKRSITTPFFRPSRSRSATRPGSARSPRTVGGSARPPRRVQRISPRTKASGAPPAARVPGRYPPRRRVDCRPRTSTRRCSTARRNRTPSKGSLRLGSKQASSIGWCVVSRTTSTRPAGSRSLRTQTTDPSSAQTSPRPKRARPSRGSQPSTRRKRVGPS